MFDIKLFLTFWTAFVGAVLVWVGWWASRYGAIEPCAEVGSIFFKASYIFFTVAFVLLLMYSM